jgi:hypothetical protein
MKETISLQMHYPILEGFLSKLNYPLSLTMDSILVSSLRLPEDKINTLLGQTSGEHAQKEI